MKIKNEINETIEKKYVPSLQKRVTSTVLLLHRNIRQVLCVLFEVGNSVERNKLNNNNANTNKNTPKKLKNVKDETPAAVLTTIEEIFK